MAHPDIRQLAQRIDIMRWGHGMVKPVPGFLWGEDRALAAAPLGRISFANTDLAGMALFEEAHWHGMRAAEEILTTRGVPFESLQ